jgi:hypothetical protein
MVEDDGYVDGGGSGEIFGFPDGPAEEKGEKSEDADAEEHKEEIIDFAATTDFERGFQEELHGAPGDGGDPLTMEKVDEDRNDRERGGQSGGTHDGHH